MIQQGCKPPLDQGHSCCEVGVTPSLPCHRKMPSRCFEDIAQPGYHSNIEDFYCQICFETVDTVANVEHFNQKDYTMYANCEQALLKGTLGNLSHKMSTNCMSSTQSLTLIPYEFSYLYWQSSITVSGKVKAWLIHCIMSLTS